MKIDPSQHSAAENYKLLTNLVVPRPIAWVTSLNKSGTINLAPFSFFNAVSGEPLFIVVSVGYRDNESQKDTARNVLESGEFVVNMVNEGLMNAMTISAADFPAGVSELQAAGLHAAPSEKIKVPRVAESPVNLECRLHTSLTLGSNTLLVGEVLMFHVADHLIDPIKLHIHDFSPIGRMGSPSTYCRTIDRFELPRVAYQQIVNTVDRQ